MSEIEELRAENERLTRWKSEATEVILGLQDLGRALELPLGERITGEAAAEAARTLKAEVERLRAAVTRVGEADQQTIHMYSAAMVRWNARAESSEAALVSEREAHAGLRERLEALHRPWYEVNGVHHDHTVLVYGSDVPEGHVCRIGPFYDRCVIEPESPEDSQHSVLACYECRAATDEGEAGYLLWPCATIRALADPAAPVAAEEGGEQEAGEAKCAGVRVEGRMSGMLCDPDGTVRGGLWHHGTDYECTGSAHLGPDEVIVCANPVHDVEWHVPAPSGSDEQGNRPATPDANGVHDTTGGE